MRRFVSIVPAMKIACCLWKTRFLVFSVSICPKFSPPEGWSDRAFRRTPISRFGRKTCQRINGTGNLTAFQRFQASSASFRRNLCQLNFHLSLFHLGARRSNREWVGSTGRAWNFWRDWKNAMRCCVQRRLPLRSFWHRRGKTPFKPRCKRQAKPSTFRASGWSSIATPIATRPANLGCGRLEESNRPGRGVIRDGARWRQRAKSFDSHIRWQRVAQVRWTTPTRF